MSHIIPENPPKPLYPAREAVRVLFVEANDEAARRLEALLLRANDGVFHVEWVGSLARALKRLAHGDIDVVLAGSNLPPCTGSEVFKRLRQVAPEALVLPLGATTGTSAYGGHGLDSAMSPMLPDWLQGALQYVARRKSTEAAWRLADEALFDEKERARLTLGSIGDGVLVTDTEGNVSYLNPVAESLTGWSISKAYGKPLSVVFDITDNDTGEQARNPALHAMSENSTVGLAANCVLHRLDGSEARIEDSAAPVHDRNGRVTGAVIVFRDVNQSQAMTRKMAWLAGHDALTGAVNRVLFEERFSQVTSLADRHAAQAAILFVDLDNFKQINDSLGHRVGDHVLQMVVGHLLCGVRDTDTVCRHGGDEFVILLAEVASPAAAKQAAAKLLSLFAEPLQVEGHEVKVAMSMGISIYPDDGKDVHSLVARADSAMYQAKAKGENICEFPSSTSNATAMDLDVGTP